MLMSSDKIEKFDISKVEAIGGSVPQFVDYVDIEIVDPLGKSQTSAMTDHQLDNQSATGTANLKPKKEEEKILLKSPANRLNK